MPYNSTMLQSIILTNIKLQCREIRESKYVHSIFMHTVNEFNSGHVSLILIKFCSLSI